MRRALNLIGVVAVFVLIAASCSEEESEEPREPGVPAVEDDREDHGELSDLEGAALVAEATTTAVGYFEALAVNDYSRASDRSSGAAQLAVRWREATNEVDAADGSQYDMPPIDAPAVYAELESVSRDGDELVATGFLELDERPGGVPSTTTTAVPEEVHEDLRSIGNTFVTDLVFVEHDGRLRLDDYRYDDVEYPVSELYLDAADDGVPTDDVVTTEEDAVQEDAVSEEDAVEEDGTIGTEANPEEEDALTADEPAVRDGDARLLYGYRNPADGTVRYLIDHDDAGTQMVEAEFFAEDESPEPDAIGESMDVYADPAGEPGVSSLVVRPGAFPGTHGTIRATFDDEVDGAETAVEEDVTTAEEAVTEEDAPGVQDDTHVVDIFAPEFPTLGEPRSTNEVRDRVLAQVTTTTVEDDPEEAPDPAEPTEDPVLPEFPDEDEVVEDEDPIEPPEDDTVEDPDETMEEDPTATQQE